jgi:hypothetical protein
LTGLDILQGQIQGAGSQVISSPDWSDAYFLDGFKMFADCRVRADSPRPDRVRTHPERQQLTPLTQDISASYIKLTVLSDVSETTTLFGRVPTRHSFRGTGSISRSLSGSAMLPSAHRHAHHDSSRNTPWFPRYPPMLVQLRCWMALSLRYLNVSQK